MSKLIWAALVPTVLAASLCRAGEDPCSSGLPWYMTKKPASGESSVYLVLNSKQSVNVRVCYCTGPDDTYIWVRANDSTDVGARLSPPALQSMTPDQIKDRLAGGTWVSELYRSACTIAGGTNVWLANYNDQAVRGTFEILK